MNEYLLCRLIGFILGFLLDTLIGDPKIIPNPMCLLEQLIEKAEKKVRAKYPSDRNGELKAGRMLVIYVVLPALIIPLALSFAAYLISPVAYVALEAVMCYYVLTAGSLRKTSIKIYRCLMEKDIEGARSIVSSVVGYDTEELDEKAIVRIAVEYVAKNIPGRVVSPVIYAAIGGGVLGFVYRAVNMMDVMIGHRNKKYLFFGRCAARIDMVLNFIPARIAVFLTVIASYFADFDAINAMKIYRRDRKKYQDMNAGHTVAVCAGAFDITLGGNISSSGQELERPVIGDAIRDVELYDIKSVDKLMYATAIITGILCVAVMLVIWKFI